MAIAALGGDVRKGKIGGKHQPLRFGDAATGDFRADAVAESCREKPVEANTCTSRT